MAKEKEQFNPGPPMATKLGMSEDWLVTGWDEVNGCWAHFFLRKVRRKGAKSYDMFELECEGVRRRNGKMDTDLGVSKVWVKDGKPKKTDPTHRIKSVDDAVELVEELLSLEDDEEDEEDEDEWTDDDDDDEG